MTLGTVARQAPLSKGFSRQEYWSGLPFPSPGVLPNPGTEPGSPALQADSLLSEPPGKPSTSFMRCHILCRVLGYHGMLSKTILTFEYLLGGLTGVVQLSSQWRFMQWCEEDTEPQAKRTGGVGEIGCRLPQACLPRRGVTRSPESAPHSQERPQAHGDHLGAHWRLWAQVFIGGLGTWAPPASMFPSSEPWMDSRCFAHFTEPEVLQARP